MFTQEKQQHDGDKFKKKVPFYIVLTHLCLPRVCLVTPQEDYSTC